MKLDGRFGKRIVGASEDGSLNRYVLRRQTGNGPQAAEKQTREHHSQPRTIKQSVLYVPLRRIGVIRGWISTALHGITVN